MKDFVAGLVRQYQLLTAWQLPYASPKNPKPDDVTMAWISRAEVYSALVHVVEVAEGRMGLRCPDFVPSGHTVLIASDDGTGSWGVVSRCTEVPSGYRVDVELH